MSEFSKGDIAVVVETGIKATGKDQTGNECLVASKPQYGLKSGVLSYPWYWCEFEGDPSPSGPNGAWAIQEKFLRKKKTPQEKLMSWKELQKDLGMSSTKVTVDA